MPYIVTCPKCDTKLKSGQPVPAGRSLTCPQCKTNFTLKEPAIEVGGAPAAPRSAAAPSPPSTVKTRPVAARKDDDDDRPRGKRRDDDEDERPRSRRRDEDEEDDRPKSKRRPADDEDEDERPKSRKRRDDDEEEDERPKARKSRDDDDDEDRPKSKRRPADDEEDERPKSRKSRDDEEDEDEDQPKSKLRRARDEDDEDDDRPRGRGKKKKGSKKLVLILGALAALFLVCGGGGGFLFYYFDPFGMFGSGSSDMVAWVPSEMQSVEGANVDAISKNTKMMSSVRPDVKEIETAGIKLEDMSSFVLGKRTGIGGTEVYVVKTKSSIDKDKVIKALGGQKQTANGKEYYRTKDNGGLYFPSDKMLVLTKTENMLSNRLAADTGKVLLSDDLKAALKKVDGDLWSASAGANAGPFGDMSKGGMPGVVAPPPPKAVVMNAKLQSSGDVVITMEMMFNDSDAAKKAKDAIDGLFTTFKNLMNMGGAMMKGPEAAKMQEQKKMMDSAKVTQSGNSVIITMTGSVDAFEGFGKMGR